MTPKRKLYLIVSAAIVVVVLLVVAILLWRKLGGRGEDTMSAVPDEAVMVARVDTRSLLQSPEAKRGPRLPLSKLGIDASRKAYLFVWQGYVGAVIPLTDRGQLLDRTSAIHSSVVRQRGLSWTVFGGSWLAALDKGKAIVVGPLSKEEQDALREPLLELMTRGKTTSVSPLLQELSGLDSPIAMAALMDILPESLTKWVKAVVPEGVGVSDLMLTASLSLEGDDATIKLNVGGRTKKATAFLTQLDEVFLPLGSNLSTPQSLGGSREHALLHIEAGLDGDKLLQLLRGNPTTRTRLLAAGMLFDIDMILRSIHGNIALTLPRLSLSSPEMLVEAELCDSAFMRNIPDWNEGLSRDAGIQFLPARNGCYLTAFGGQAYYFGVRDGHLFVTNSERYTIPTPADPSSATTLVAEGVKAYGELRLDEVSPLLAALPMVGSVLTPVKGLTLTATSATEWTLTFDMRQGTGLLEQLVSLWNE